MSPRADISRELGPYVEEHEVESIDRLAERLFDERHTPAPGFRARLRSRLAALAETERARRPPRRRAPLAVRAKIPRTIKRPRRRPTRVATPAGVAPVVERPHLALTVAVYVGAGLLVLGVAALGAAGAGPLAP
jgi:hypothetical protein